MFSLRASSFLLVIALVVTLLYGLFVPAVTHAQSNTSFCPITNNPIVIEQNVTNQIREVGDNLQETIILTNLSEYFMGGLQVSVGVYAAGGDTPSYWTTLANQNITLSSGQSKPVLLDLDLRWIPAGTYDYRVFVSQAKPLHSYGHAMLKSSNIPQAASIVKSTVQKNTLQQNISVNGQSADMVEIGKRNRPTINLITTNLSDEEIHDATVQVALHGGGVPLGTAILASQDQDLFLLANGELESRLVNRHSLVGNYGVTALVNKPGALLPISTTKISAGPESTNDYAAYISAIGLTDMPLGQGSSIVTCFGQTGSNHDGVAIGTPLAVKHTMTDANDITVEELVELNSESGGTDYTSSAVTKLSNTFTLHTELLEQKGATAEDDNVSVQKLSGFERVQIVRQAFDCNEYESCRDELSETVKSFAKDETVQQSFWFYAGIVIAAALLLFIVLRRLEPHAERESITSIGSRSKSNDELQ